jgi:hypothetical protein
MTLQADSERNDKTTPWLTDPDSLVSCLGARPPESRACPTRIVFALGVIRTDRTKERLTQDEIERIVM